MPRVDLWNEYHSYYTEAQDSMSSSKFRQVANDYRGKFYILLNFKRNVNTKLYYFLFDQWKLEMSSGSHTKHSYTGTYAS